MPPTRFTKPARQTSVFINCPFDRAYRPMLRAMCFAVMACGYTPRCALDALDSGASRFEKILDLLCACDFAIHDISRVEPDEDSGLPRFNMSLELGADLGLRRRGGKAHAHRLSLVLDSAEHRYDQTLSDLSGSDISVHGGTPTGVIKAVRDWLSDNRPNRADTLPGARALISDHELFVDLGAFITSQRHRRLDPFEELTHADLLSVAREALWLISFPDRGSGSERFSTQSR